MTLDEAIKHCEEKAQENYLQGMLCHANPNDEELDKCIECAKEHEQLKEWLEEYKVLKERTAPIDNPSFKFEELKEGDWVWDNKNNSWLKVIGIYGFNIHVQFGIGIYKNDCYVEFEENRFYPVQCANEVQL